MQALEDLQAAIGLLQRGLSGVQAGVCGVSGLEAKVDVKLLNLRQPDLPACPGRPPPVGGPEVPVACGRFFKEARQTNRVHGTPGSGSAGCKLILYGLPQHAQENAGCSAAAILKGTERPPAPIRDARRLGPRLPPVTPFALRLSVCMR